MMVLSTKITKRKIVAFALVCACIALILIISIPPADATAGKQNKTTIKTNEERVNFLASYGWSVEAEPIEVVDIVIPTKFDDTYESYNMLQKTQGFDLAVFKGKKVTRYTYQIKNYPSTQESPVHANLLIYDSKLIGGDVTSISLGGFMHGFEKPVDTVGTGEGSVFVEGVAGPSADEIMSEILQDIGK